MAGRIIFEGVEDDSAPARFRRWYGFLCRRPAATLVASISEASLLVAIFVASAADPSLMVATLVASSSETSLLVATLVASDAEPSLTIATLVAGSSELSFVVATVAAGRKCSCLMIDDRRLNGWGCRLWPA